MIAVTDDGCGMSPAELPMALQRHATSKLASAADLMRIASFGFRGEALPAIASVSRFRILSRARGSEHGYEIQCDAGRIVHEREAGGPEGTRIEVADLFASVPARRKFLKRPGTEWGHIADWLARLAIVRPEVHIETQRDGRAASIWPACRDPRDRIATILSEEDAASLVEIDHPTPDCRIRAFLSTPEHTRPNSQALYLFVNGRPVRDRLLRHALIESYRDLLPRGRFPIGVLFVEIAMDAVDVNVHPAKWEVRFSDPQAVHRAVRHAVREAMASRTWLGGIQAPTLPTRSGTPTGATEGAMRTAEAPTDDWIFAGRDIAGRLGDAGADAARRPLGEAALEEGNEAVAFDFQGSTASTRPVPSFASLPILGQLRASYLLAETEDGLMVVDQHAAHERILYERLRGDWLESGVARQGLLTPTPVTLAPKAVAALEAARDVALRLGFEIESFGEDAVLVRTLPAEMAGQDVTTLVTELAAVLEESEREGLSDASDGSAIRWLPSLDRLFATLACHSARRFGDRLPAAEQQAILAGLDSIPWAPTCPHGRPVAILIRHEDLEQRFRRR